MTIIALKKERKKNIASKKKSRSYYYDNAGYGDSSPDTKLVELLTHYQCVYKESSVFLSN